MSRCKTCNKVLIEGAKFCFECGTRVEQKIYCSNCGKECVEGAKFCFNCGQPVKNGEGTTKSEVFNYQADVSLEDEVFEFSDNDEFSDNGGFWEDEELLDNGDFLNDNKSFLELEDEKFLNNESKRKKIEAKAIAEKAEQMLLRANSIEEHKKGIKKYLEAMQITWEEERFQGISFSVSVPETPTFKKSCSMVASAEFQSQNYEEAFEYANYGCGTQEIEGFGLILTSNYSKDPNAKEENAAVDTCLIIMCFIYYYVRKDIKKALQLAECGLGSRKLLSCAVLLGDHYAQSDNMQDILLACDYYDRMGQLNDPKLIEKRNLLTEKVVEFRSKEVNNVMNTFSSNWLPAPMGNGTSWERYSNLSDQEFQVLNKKSKNKDVISVVLVEDSFKAINYTPGQINLKTLWEYYKQAHLVAHTTGTIFKKKVYTYAGDLYERDFVECVRYIWKKKYNL